MLNFGSFQDITGAGRVPVGAQACKTGSTTGTTCGIVLAYNVTINYAEGTVFGLTRTNICTQPGDNGGADVRRQSGPRHRLRRHGRLLQLLGFRSFLQPADEPLNVYGPTLL